MERSESIVKLIQAMIAAQSSFGELKKNKYNPHLKYHYADLDSMKNSTMPALKANGLTLNFFPHTQEGKNYMQAMLAHESGEFILCRYEVSPEKTGMQGMGSAWTYLKRYIWGSICSLYDDENDDAVEETLEKQKKTTQKSFASEEVEVINISPTEEQIKLLTDIFAQLPEEEEKTGKWLRDRGFHSYTDMPMALFEKVLKKAELKLQEKTNGS